MRPACIGADLFYHSELTLLHIGWLVGWCCCSSPMRLLISIHYSADETGVLFIADGSNYLVSAMGHGVDIAFVSIIERSIDGIADNGVVFSGREEDVLDVDGDTPAVGRPAV